MSGTPTTSSANGSPLKMDGKALSQRLLATYKEAYERRVQGRSELPQPRLVVVTVGPSAATMSYLKHKRLACETVGFAFENVSFEPDISPADLSAGIRDLAARADVHGIIIQMPLPRHIDPWETTQLVPPAKDVDGLHASNQGRIQIGLRTLLPCTPQGCMELLHHYKLLRRGMLAVVMGRSPLVGKPMANLLMGREGDCTVTVVNRSTKPEVRASTLRAADLIVTAVGVADTITADMVKPGAILVDVGINFVPDATKKTGVRMVGDANRACWPLCSAYTPVPGGVGPMTVAMLMRNVLDAFCQQNALEPLDEDWRKTARIYIP